MNQEEMIHNLKTEMKYLREDVKDIKKVLIEGNGRKPIILDLESLKVQVKVLAGVCVFCATTIGGLLINQVFKHFS